VAISTSPDGRVEATVAGELDLAATSGVGQSLRRHLATAVVVNLEGVTFMDSSGIRCLLQLRSEAVERGGRLTVGERSAVVDRLLEVSGLRDVLLVEG
jgi:anti-sigma B factor antagonist